MAKISTNSFGRRSHAGFTLVELLVVIGILLVLMGMILPVVGAAWTSVEKSRQKASFSSISMALEAYKQDFGDYPRPAIGQNDRGILCKCLLGPGPAQNPQPTDPGPIKNVLLQVADGHDGYGFCVSNSQGRVWGPYLDTSRFPWASESSSEWQPSILDNWGNAILYFVATQVPNPQYGFADPSTGNSNFPYVVGQTTLYNAADAEQGRFDTPNSKAFTQEVAYALGVSDGNIPNIGLTTRSLWYEKTQRFGGPFLLVSAGQGRVYTAAASDVVSTPADLAKRLVYNFDYP